MPLVQIQHVAGAFTRAQQTRLIEEITDAFVRVGGEGIRANVLLTMTEVQGGLWASGGVPVTLEDIERRRAARSSAPT